MKGACIYCDKLIKSTHEHFSGFAHKPCHKEYMRRVKKHLCVFCGEKNNTANLYCGDCPEIYTDFPEI